VRIVCLTVFQITAVVHEVDNKWFIVNDLV